MRIESARFRNYGPHRDRTIAFGLGLTAIIGLNGSGKSYILGGIRFGLTGENPNHGNIADNICDLAPTTEVSFVEVTFSHAGVRATVKRNLRPNKPTAELVIHTTGERVTKDVTSRVLSILQINSDVLNNMVIVGQRDVFGFLAQTYGKRAEAFQQLFHTGKADRLYDLLGNHQRSLEIPATSANLEELQAQLDAAVTEHQTRTAQLQTLSSFATIQQSRDLNSEIVRLFDAYQRLAARYVEQQSQLGQLQGSATTLKGFVDTLQGEIDTLVAAVQTGAAGCTEATLILHNLEAWQRQQSIKTSLIERINAADQQLASLSRPIAPAEFVEDQSALQAECAHLDIEWAQYSRLLHNLKGDIAACPTCGTPMSNLQNEIAKARLKIPEIEQRRSTISLILAASNTYQTQLNTYGRDYESYRARRQLLQQQLDELPPLSQVVGDPGVLRDRLTLQQEQQRALDLKNSTYQQRSRELAGIEGRISQLQSDMQSTQQELSKIPVYTAAQRDEAVRNVALWDEAAATRRLAEQQVAVVYSRATQLQQQIRDALAVRQRGLMLRAWNELVTGWRDLFHKDAAPRFVAHRNLLRLESGINEHLATFDTTWRVSADEGLSFTALFARGSRQPAERLSEGQKVILALAFRVALNSMFAENIGALYLDEPTAYLDEHHIRGFEPVLAKLREYSESRGLQVIIITHERGLAHLFDAVVEL